MSHSWSTFGYTEDQKMMRDSVLDLLGRILPPARIRELDRNSEFPFEAYQALAKAGWMALPFEERYGGAGGSFKDLVVLIESMSYHYLNIATAYLLSTVYAGQHISLHGSEYLKQKYIPKIIDGSCRLGIAITEPEAGSDAAAIRTKAHRQEGGGYVVNGQKTFITCAHVSQYLVTAVKTDPAAGHKGISMLLVPTDAKGVEIRPLEMLGRRTIHANEVFFADVEVPPENLIGEENGGWRNLMKCLNLERLGTSTASVGEMLHIVDYASDYASNREQFGKPISSFQAVAHKLADMRIAAEAARLMTWRIADMLDAGLSPRIETAMAKVFVTESAFHCADMGLQVMGGAGYTMEHDMQRFFRDARIGPIGAGTNEIQRNIIAQLLVER